MHVSAFYASSVQLGTHPHMWVHCIYTRELALTKRTRYNTTNTCGHAQSVVGPECSNNLKGSGLCIIACRHLLRSARVLNNTEVKGHYSTICRHACFGVLRLISAACIYTRELALTKRTRYNTTNTCGHAQRGGGVYIHIHPPPLCAYTS